MGLFGRSKSDKDREDREIEKETGAGQVPEQKEEKEGGAQLDDAQAYYFLGTESLDRGDDAAAQSYFTQAAGLGYAPAQFQLGLIYENGTQTQIPDREEAARWYKMAAESGDAASQFNLGYLYYNDQETDRKEEGLGWIKKAAEGGDEAAQEFLESVKHVIEQKVQEAQERAKRKILVQRVLDRDELFFTLSPTTQHPYVETAENGEDKRVYLFVSEEAAHDKAKALDQSGMPATTVRYYKKNYLDIIGELYTLGVNSIRINEDGSDYDVYLYDIAKRRDFSELPEDKRPVSNPALQYSMLIYMQEFRRKVDKPDDEYRQKIDRQMVRNMIEGRYLMPFRDSEEKDSSQKQFVVLNNSRNKLNFIPIFTDNIEFQRFRMQFKEGKELKLMAAGFSNLADMKLPEKVEGFVINPFTTAVPLPQAYIKKVDGQRKA